MNENIKILKGVGSKKAESLERLGIFTVEQLLYHFPRNYEDHRNPRALCTLKDGEKALIKAKVLSVNFSDKNLHLLACDDTALIDIYFFHSAYLQKAFKENVFYGFFGQIKVNGNRFLMFQPEFSLFSQAFIGILPIYPLSRGLTQKEMRKIIPMAFSYIEESLPPWVLEKNGLCSLTYAFQNIHFPKDTKGYQVAKSRIIYEEFFDLKLALLLSKNRFGNGRKAAVISSGFNKKLLKTFSYKLTKAQKRCLLEILEDLKSGGAMNRLLQGDVGSGKTAVAMAALAETVGAGFQGVFMAPTEILAKQHYNTLVQNFEALGISVGLFLGNQKPSEKKKALKALQTGEIQIAVGTHALISENVIFQNLGLAITDEQHRFGVNQRKKLNEKGENPHVLVMTATPIPRTLAMVFYGDLEVSSIDVLPKGRIPIKTSNFSNKTRKQAYDFLEKEVEKGHQAYIVAPFIEDSEEIEGKSAMGVFEEFKKRYPKISSALLHGNMKQDEKDKIMEDFSLGKISVLISTVVIEVGIDVPNATVILIEDCQRFGLAQLHQLRGRVGRGKWASYCFLILSEPSEIARKRAELLCSSCDGFYIAQKDLEMRGPGELFGYRQHGISQLRLADPIKHLSIAKIAELDAEELFNKDPKLEALENQGLNQHIRRNFIENNIL